MSRLFGEDVELKSPLGERKNGWGEEGDIKQ